MYGSTSMTDTMPGMSAGAGAEEMTAARMLEETDQEFCDKGVKEPRRWAEALVAYALDVPTAELDDVLEEPVSSMQVARLRGLTRQVNADTPVAYLIGRAPFFDLDFEVTRDTLIPKTDTELFLRIVFQQIGRDPLPRNARVLELCCGSGCVASTLARYIPGSQVVATDISDGALTVATHNVHRHRLADRVTLMKGDLFGALGSPNTVEPFDLIVSNPPYIPTQGISAMGRHVAEHEPHLALDGGDDGLDFHRRILAEAPRYLSPGGRVFLEHEWYHGTVARSLAAAYPAYREIRTYRDARGKDRALYVRAHGLTSEP